MSLRPDPDSLAVGLRAPGDVQERQEEHQRRIARLPLGSDLWRGLWREFTLALDGQQSTSRARNNVLDLFDQLGVRLPGEAPGDLPAPAHAPDCPGCGGHGVEARLVDTGDRLTWQAHRWWSEDPQGPSCQIDPGEPLVFRACGGPG